MVGTGKNILCLVDDTLLLDPSVPGLQVLIHSSFSGLRELSLNLNDQKYPLLVFKRNRHRIDRQDFIGGRKLDQVSRCVYLGNTLTEYFPL